jgi:hypothetical protein
MHQRLLLLLLATPWLGELSSHATQAAGAAPWTSAATLLGIVLPTTLPLMMQRAIAAAAAAAATLFRIR